MAFYSVCTECSFMRVYATASKAPERLSECPACGGEVHTQEQGERFEPAYMGRVTSALYGEPASGRGRQA
jgi:hypothetical protein